jgi:hypothetical protein
VSETGTDGCSNMSRDMIRLIVPVPGFVTARVSLSHSTCYLPFIGAPFLPHHSFGENDREFVVELPVLLIYIINNYIWHQAADPAVSCRPLLNS